MSERVLKFDESEPCDECGIEGAFGVRGQYLCADCLMGPEDPGQVREERDFLRDENAKLQRMVKTRDNKIKHLRGQLSVSKLKKRLEEQSETIKNLGQKNAELKREKLALHEYIDRQLVPRNVNRPN